MSSKKKFNVDCELTLHYGLMISAKDEDEALEKAQERLELIATTQSYKSQIVDYNAEFGDVEELD